MILYIDHSLGRNAYYIKIRYRYINVIIRNPIRRNVSSKLSNVRQILPILLTTYGRLSYRDIDYRCGCWYDDDMSKALNAVSKLLTCYYVIFGTLVDVT